LLPRANLHNAEPITHVVTAYDNLDGVAGASVLTAESKGTVKRGPKAEAWITALNNVVSPATIGKGGSSARRFNIHFEVFRNHATQRIERVGIKVHKPHGERKGHFTPYGRAMAKSSSIAEKIPQILNHIFRSPFGDVWGEYFLRNNKGFFMFLHHAALLPSDPLPKSHVRHQDGENFAYRMRLVLWADPETFRGSWIFFYRTATGHEWSPCGDVGQSPWDVYMMSSKAARDAFKHRGDSIGANIAVLCELYRLLTATQRERIMTEFASAWRAAERAVLEGIA
jgi:hypothetical protein